MKLEMILVFSVIFKLNDIRYTDEIRCTLYSKGIVKVLAGISIQIPLTDSFID